MEECDKCLHVGSNTRIRNCTVEEREFFLGCRMLALSGQMQATEIRHQGRHSAGQILISEKKNYRMHLHVFITLIVMHFNKTKFNTVLDT